MSNDTATDDPAASDAGASRPGGRRRPRWLRYAVIGAIGLALAVVQFLLDDRDPLVFSIPILVLTVLVLTVMAIASPPGDGDDLPAGALAEGLEDDGVRPLPPVTPILAGVRAPARVFSGQLYEDGPWVRLARVGDELVAVTGAPAQAVDPGAQEWLDEHELRPRAAIDEGLLVLAVAAGTPPRRLLDLLRHLHARL